MSTVLYVYEGRDSRGKLVKGKLEAPNEAAAVSRMRTLGLTPVAVRQSASGTGLQREISIPGFEKRVKLKDIAVASRQLSTMVNAGLPLVRALVILSSQTEVPRLKAALEEVTSAVEGGSSLSEALARQGSIFPILLVHLVRAGETGGYLDQSLTSAAETFEKDVKLRQTIVSAMTYPVVVLIIAILAVIAMLIFIVPVFEQMFANMDGELPLPTQILVWLSKAMVFIAPVLLVATIVFTFWWRANKDTDRVRGFVDPLKLRLPVFGQLFQKIAIARFARNFATMTKAGVPILQALAVVGETSGSWVLARALDDVQDSVRSGQSLAGPLANHPVFPTMVTQMIAVGEDAGSLEQMLNKIGEFYEAEVQATTEQLTSLIEPLMIVVIGVIIGGMIVALYLPLFSIYDQIQ